MQGRNLTPLVNGETVPWRREWFYEHMFEHDWIPRTEGVRTEKEKYTLYLDTEPQFEEVFNLQRDPLEENNLAPKSPPQLGQLRERHQLWRRTLEAWRPTKEWSDPA